MKYIINTKINNINILKSFILYLILLLSISCGRQQKNSKGVSARKYIDAVNGKLPNNMNSFDLDQLNQYANNNNLINYDTDLNQEQISIINNNIKVLTEIQKSSIISTLFLSNDNKTNEEQRLNNDNKDETPTSGQYIRSKILPKPHNYQVKKDINRPKFKPKYSTRAHLNIFISKELTQTLLDKIKEKFKDKFLLYYYLDISTGMQMDDDQMEEFKILVDYNKENKLSIINYDLHCKQTNQSIYGIIIPTTKDKVNQNKKYPWTLDSFMTAKEILDKYKIKKLPKSSREMKQFKNQLNQKLIISKNMIDYASWSNIPQIYLEDKDINITIEISEKLWIKECYKSFADTSKKLIPIVIKTKNKHWIEWIKIINIKPKKVVGIKCSEEGIGVSCRYNKEEKLWKVTSLYLNYHDIINKNILVGQNYECNKQLINFSDFPRKIKIIKDASHYTECNDKIDRSMQNCYDLKNYLTEKIKKIEREITLCQRTNHRKHKKLQKLNIKNKRKEIRLSKINLKKLSNSNNKIFYKNYKKSKFQTFPCGTKQNIYIYEEFAKSLLNSVIPRFKNVEMLYHYIDCTTSLQMIQGYSRQYKNKKNNQFIIRIINYELTNNNNESLYGIIELNNNISNVCQNVSKNDLVSMENTDHQNIFKCKQYKDIPKFYPYKLTQLMTKEQIIVNYGINPLFLPQRSRENKDFIHKLSNTPHLDHIKSNQIEPNTLDLGGTEYIINKNIFIKNINHALKNLNKNNTNKLIPIIILDEHKICYDIEWVLIVNDFGISFRYDYNSDIKVSKFYPDKNDIEVKHKQIGLKTNYCESFPAFSMKSYEQYAFLKDNRDRDSGIKRSINYRRPPKSSNYFFNRTITLCESLDYDIFTNYINNANIYYQKNLEYLSLFINVVRYNKLNIFKILLTKLNPNIIYNKSKNNNDFSTLINFFIWCYLKEDIVDKYKIPLNKFWNVLTNKNRDGFPCDISICCPFTNNNCLHYLSDFRSNLYKYKNQNKCIATDLYLYDKYKFRDNLNEINSSKLTPYDNSIYDNVTYNKVVINKFSLSDKLPRRREKIKCLFNNKNEEYNKINFNFLTRKKCINCKKRIKNYNNNDLLNSKTSYKKSYKCSGCKATYYCSKKCQKIHWKSKHRILCVRSLK
ncbi:MAG: hypothetical protein GY830_06055 [Bacteroidetes bacterium]|nr:hypothetical protein [Bacteroidota bacterium]